MHYYLYKLAFSTPVHFGADVPGIGEEKCKPTACADTLFSALCHEILLLQGTHGIATFYEMTESGNLLLSDLMPYDENNYYLPKPVLALPHKEKSAQKEDEAISVKKKKMKKLTHIPLKDWYDYLTGADTFEPNPPDLWQEIVTTKVAVSRTTSQDSDPYSVSGYVFKKDAGLYFIVGLKEEKFKETLSRVLESLGYSGIGGERSSGYGKFEIVDDFEISSQSGIEAEKLLYNLLTQKAERYLSLSVVSPKPSEIKELDSYKLIPRKGFVLSTSYADKPLQRKQVTMLASGSCFSEKIEGQILDLSKDGSHPVYRYGKALMIGV